MGSAPWLCPHIPPKHLKSGAAFEGLSVTREEGAFVVQASCHPCPVKEACK